MRWILTFMLSMAVGAACFAQVAIEGGKQQQAENEARVARERALEAKALAEAEAAKREAAARVMALPQQQLRRGEVGAKRTAPDVAVQPPTTIPVIRTASPTTRPSAQVIKSLVDQLSSDDWTLRQKAQDKIVDLGEDALPDLKQYLADATDEEVRTRLEGAIRQIEASIQSGPTRITLHVKDAPLMDAIGEISKQAGVRIGFENQSPPNPMPTLSMDVDRQPFWLVMKEIAAKTGVGPAPYYSNQRDIIALQQGSNFARLPAYNAGRFYVTASNASRSHYIDYANPQNANTSFYVQMAIWIDPKMKVLRSGYQLDMQEVTDDKGNSLMTGANMGAGWTSGQNYRRDVSVQLKYMPEIGKKIAKLKGSAQFLLQTKSEKWEITDILNAKDVTKNLSSGKYTIKQVKKTGDGVYEVNIIVELPPNLPAHMAAIADFSTVQETMKLMDASGRVYWMGGGGGGGDGRKMDYKYTFRRDMGGPNQPGDPAKLVWDIPLETQDVAVPVEMKNLELP